MTSMASTKRPRSPSPPVGTEPAPKALRTPSPAPKALPSAAAAAATAGSTQRSGGGCSAPLITLCTLPPTCDPPRHAPTRLAARDARAIERHHQMYHAHVCGACDAVFPEERFLDLHQTENHDPLAAMRKERGEKIFGCFVPSCTRYFGAPKTRRLHLVQAHGYPKQYFFAVTNRGVGGLLRRYGEGASLVRGEWHQREGGAADAPTSSDEDGSEGEDADAADEERMQSDAPPPARAAAPKPGAPPASAPAPPRDAPPHIGRAPRDPAQSVPPRTTRPLPAREAPPRAAAAPDTALDALAADVARMQLAPVPEHVRFGRGGTGRGFSGRAGGAAGHGAGRAHRGGKGAAAVDESPSALAFVPHSVAARARGERMVP